MPFHVQTLTAPIIKLMWILPDGAEFKKDEYDGTVVISIDPYGGFIELQGFIGYKYKGQRFFTKQQYINVLNYFRELSAEYDLPVRAERLPGHSLPGFEFDGVKYFWLKG